MVSVKCKEIAMFTFMGLFFLSLGAIAALVALCVKQWMTVANCSQNSQMPGKVLAITTPESPQSNEKTSQPLLIWLLTPTETTPAKDSSTPPTTSTAVELDTIWPIGRPMQKLSPLTSRPSSLHTTTTVPTVKRPAVENLKHRINCFPEQQGSNEKEWAISPDVCMKRGCRYDRDTGGDKYVPICYMHPHEIGYKVTRVLSSTEEEDPGWFLSLKLEPLSNTAVFDPPIHEVSFKARIWNKQHLQIKIEDMNDTRYEVPFKSQLVKDPLATVKTADFEMIYTTEPFSFQVKRKSTGTVLFDTSIGGFVFSDRFLQLSTFLPSKNLYGIGEHEHPSLRHDMDRYRTWPIFARDQGGLGEGTNLYGTHPFYMVLENDGNSHGVFFLNSNAMEFSTIPAPGVIFRTIGGIFDLHISTGPTPEQVIEQHTAMIGRPFIPPYWALGFHLSRYGYNSLKSMRDAVDRTRLAGIPLDVIYADIDHMNERKDLTIDPVHFAGLSQYLADELKNNGLRSVIILDPAIPDVPTGDYSPWHAFKSKDAYITWQNGSVMYGYVWPVDKAAFPDFLQKNARDTWIDLIVQHSKTIAFDGIWIDMNEPANFGTNEEKPWNWPNGIEPWSLKCPPSDYENPPYRTWAASLYDNLNRKIMLSDKTICMEARQGEGGKYRHYDVHNLYGWSQTPPTLEAVQKAYPGRRGFVLTRSTFAGSGQYATHWLGDNKATWEHMHRSIIGMLEMSMFGIAHTGPDICGFVGDSTPELCLRWMQLGAFYPYSRNHNDLASRDQDPASFGENVARESAYYMKLRYKILPYLYTLFYYANRDGSTVARPLFFEFPGDQITWPIDRQFMLGPSFLVAPLLNQNEDTLTAYLPKGTWINWAQLLEFIDHCSGGANKRFDNNGPSLLQRGGSIVPTQSTIVPSGGKNITTEATRKNPFTLHTVFDCDDKAQGSLFWDDGDSINTVETEKYLLAEYKAEFDILGRLRFVSKLVHDAKSTTICANLHYEALVFYGKKLTDAVKVEIASKDASTSLTCDEFEPSKNMLTCNFPVSGRIPITNDFIVTITF